MTRRQAAAWRRVAPSTLQYWLDRFRQASDDERRSGSWADDRPSTPKRQPRLSSPELHERVSVCEQRRRTGWGPRLIASELQVQHATVSRCLERRRLSRRPKPAKEEVRRFEGPCPGDLLQMDTKRFARFSRRASPGGGRIGPLRTVPSAALTTPGGRAARGAASVRLVDGDVEAGVAHGLV